MLAIGAHVDQADPIAEAAARSAEVVQIFLGDPQDWKPPTIAYLDGADALKAAVEAAGLALYVHAPYLVNVASSNNRIRMPSRKILQQQIDAAASIGARGLIVHGGHVLAKEDPSIGVENWRKTFERMEMRLPILIENTAGGDNAMARKLDALSRLWDAVGEFGAGFCLDTCHAFAGGEDLVDVVDRVRAITGRIDLVHLNNSRDEFDSARDRHANIAAGTIDPEQLVAVCAAAGAPVVCETPAEGLADDIAFLRERLG